MRKTVFANDEYYHIYNRGVDKQDVFMDGEDYKRFLLSMNLLNDVTNGLMQQYRNMKRDGGYKVQPSGTRRLDLGERLDKVDKLVDVVCYCLNSNHYHTILKQKSDDGIKKFMHKLSTSYTMYFNKKQKRSGSLFQGKFKSIHIDSNEYLLYLSAYVNGNNFIHGGKREWKYSSYLDYIDKRDGTLCNKKPILAQFGNVDEYRRFLNNNMLYLKNKKELQKYILE